MVFQDPASRDQDDMAIWINPRETTRSTVITSDKKANAVFIYDLEGKTLQVVPSLRPGNIDIRIGYALGGSVVDIVAWNERATRKIVVCKVDPDTRTLERIDDGSLEAHDAYGCALYHSRSTGNLYFFTTSKTGFLHQYVLFESPAGKVTGRRVRSVMLGACEAAVADDDTASLYVSVERQGIWKLGAEPSDASEPIIIDCIGKNGLQPDIEGITIYRKPDEPGFLLVSSQGNSRFNVYERMPPHRFIGSFCVRGVRFTDGIDVTSADCGGKFTKGFFVCHNGTQDNKCPIVLVPWETIENALKVRDRRP